MLGKTSPVGSRRGIVEEVQAFRPSASSVNVAINRSVFIGKGVNIPESRRKPVINL